MSTEQDLGFLLPDIEIETSTPPDRRRACFRTRKILEGIVYDTVALEGNPFTFPEVQTLMDGITVGGHKIRDAEQVLNQAESWKTTIHEVETGKFVPLKNGLQSALRLHSLVSKNEALEWGKLRTGEVGIAGTDYQPPKAENLEDIYRKGAHALKSIGNTHMRAIATFLFTARNQLFWDGNKRTGRLMMNGELLATGHDAITVPAKKRQEFNTKMIKFYDTADASEIVHFLSRCSIDRGLTIPRRNPAAREPETRTGNGNGDPPRKVAAVSKNEDGNNGTSGKPARGGDPDTGKETNESPAGHPLPRPADPSQIKIGGGGDATAPQRPSERDYDKKTNGPKKSVPNRDDRTLAR